MVAYRIVFVVSMASLALAAPQVQTQQHLREHSGVFSIPISRVDRTSGSHERHPGIDASRQAFAKWGGDRFQRVTGGHGSGDAPASPPGQEPDYEYIAPIAIGKNTYNLVLDTGVTDLWVADSAFKNLNTTCKVRKGYTWDTPLASGNVVCDDKVAVGDAAVGKQVVCVGNPKDLPDPYSDGVLGLAPGSAGSTIKPTPQKGWLANLLPTLKKPIFALDLQHEAEGSITFGDIPKQIDTKKIQWAPLDVSKGKYTVTASGGFKIGNRHFKTSGPKSAVIDTGTTLVFMTKQIVDAYYGSVQGSEFNKTAYGGWTLPCKGRIPTFTVSVGPHMVTIPSQHMTYFGVDFGNTTCYGGLQYHEDESLPYVYGDTFIKSVYAIFDLKENKLGIAPKVDKNHEL